MDNKIVYVTKSEADVIREKAVQDEDVFFAEIDGAKIKTEEDYVQAVANEFAFPVELPKMIIGWYNDYINDLMWIKQKKVIFVIKHFNEMLSDDLKLKKDILDGFEEVILPWWGGEIVGHMVGGEPKSFMIYLEGTEKNLN